MKGIKRAKKGFSLIEVIISVAILVILMIPIASVTISTVKRNAEAEEKQRAEFVGQRLLEELSSYETMKSLPGDECELNNGYKLKGYKITDTTSPNYDEVFKYETPTKFIVSDGKGDFNAKVTITRNLDTKYVDPSAATFNPDDYDQIVYFHTNPSTDINYIQFEDSPSSGKFEINDVSPFTVDNLLVLKIDKDMNMNIAKRYYPTATPDNDSDFLTAGYQSPKTITQTNKILFKICEDYKDYKDPSDSNKTKKVKLFIDSEREAPITIDVFKINQPEGNIEVNTSITNPISNSVEVSIKDKVTVNNNKSTYKAKRIGDIYTIKVEIFKQETKTLFKGDITTNILVN